MKVTRRGNQYRVTVPAGEVDASEMVIEIEFYTETKIDTMIGNKTVMYSWTSENKDNSNYIRRRIMEAHGGERNG